MQEHSVYTDEARGREVDDVVEHPPSADQIEDDNADARGDDCRGEERDRRAPLAAQQQPDENRNCRPDRGELAQEREGAQGAGDDSPARSRTSQDQDQGSHLQDHRQRVTIDRGRSQQP